MMSEIVMLCFVRRFLALSLCVTV